MYIIKTECSFDSAHFLANHNGKCANIHGHRWKVELDIQSKVLSTEKSTNGMVMDFSDIKKELKKVCEEFDHALIIESGSMREETLRCLLEDGFKIVSVDFRTTAENFSYYFYKYFKDKEFNVKRVTVYETPANCAIYEEDNE